MKKKDDSTEELEIYFFDEETGMSIDENGHTHFDVRLMEKSGIDGIELHHAFELMKRAIAEYQIKKFGHTL